MKKGWAASEVQQNQMVTRICPGVAGRPWSRTYGRGGGGRLGESRARRSALLSRGLSSANNRTCTNLVIWVTDSPEEMTVGWD